MAKGQTRNVTVKLNNDKTNMNVASRDVELIVKSGALVPDDKDLDPGVSSRNM